MDKEVTLGNFQTKSNDRKAIFFLQSTYTDYRIYVVILFNQGKWSFLKYRKAEFAFLKCT